MNTSSNIGWHVVYVRSRFEQRVHNRLIEMSIESFLPLVKTIKKWSDRKKTIYKPLIPSYLFVNIKSPMEFYQTLSVNGACSYIKFGRDYAKVTEVEIDSIKFLVGDSDITDIETGPRLPKVGEVKKIILGSLTGLDCEVVKINNKNKVIVRIDSIQQSIMATIPLRFIAS